MLAGGGRLAAFDLEAVRRDTPGTGRGIFLDSAGASRMPTPVLEAVLAHLRLEAEVGGYRAKELREEHIAAAYAAIAGLIGFAPAEVALLENATGLGQMVRASVHHFHTEDEIERFAALIREG